MSLRGTPKPLGCALLKKRGKTIDWCVRSRRKFSIIRKRIIGFETPTPSLHTSMTDGIELSKLRKPNQRFAFLKFTNFVPCNKVCANNKKVSWSSKLQFFEAPVKMPRKTLCSARCHSGAALVSVPRFYRSRMLPPEWHKGAIESRAEQFARNLARWAQTIRLLPRSSIKGFCATFPKKWHPSFLKLTFLTHP